jgi:hypothetical protein
VRVIPASIGRLRRIMRRREIQTPDRDHPINERMMARWTRNVGLLTGALVLVGVVTAIIFWRQLNVMQGQLDAMEADQRAWVKVVKVEPYVNQIGPYNGLFFVKPNTEGFLQLHFVLQNVGHSPAFKVIIGAWPQFEQTSSDLTKEEQSNCAAIGDSYPDTAMRAMNTDVIPVLFPGDTTPYDGRGLAFSPAQITKFSTGDPKLYSFWFYGCVYYRLAGSKVAHQTGFAYWVTRLEDAPIPGGKAQTGFIPWENVPPDRIQFNPMPLAAGPTN